MIFATAVSLSLSIIAILISIRAFRYTKRQTELMEEEAAQKPREDQRTADWSVKFDEAVSTILKVAPLWAQLQGGSTNVFGLVFPDSAIRHRMESYLIEGKFGHDPLRARQISSEYLRQPSVQQTILQVLEYVRKFKQDWPDEAKKFGL